MNFVSIRNKLLPALQPGSEDMGRADGDARDQPLGRGCLRHWRPPSVSHRERGAATGRSGCLQSPPGMALGRTTGVTSLGAPRAWQPQDSGPLSLVGTGRSCGRPHPHHARQRGQRAKGTKNHPSGWVPRAGNPSGPLHLRPCPVSPGHKFGPNPRNLPWLSLPTLGRGAARQGGVCPGPSAPPRSPAAPAPWCR